MYVSHVLHNSRTSLTTTAGLLGVGIGIAEVILAMRTWVIWSRSRRIAIILIICLVLVWIPIFWVLNDSLSSLVCECHITF